MQLKACSCLKINVFVQRMAKKSEQHFSIVDAAGVLTGTNPTDYLKKTRKRDLILGNCIETNCPCRIDQCRNWQWKR